MLLQVDTAENAPTPIENDSRPGLVEGNVTKQPRMWIILSQKLKTVVLLSSVNTLRSQDPLDFFLNYFFYFRYG